MMLNTLSRYVAAFLCALVALTLMTNAGLADEKTLTLQSTTSTENSGLLRAILPNFKKATGITVRVVAVGTGQALKNARNGDGDVLLVHAKPAEEQFVKDGYGVARFDVMYNDFVLIGPKDDPVGVSKVSSLEEALQKLSQSQSIFVSRGDDSGTHKAEQRYWKAAGVDPKPASGTWYREAGSGMGATINAAIGMNGYTLSDRATWISHQNKAQHTLLFEGDPALFNQYGVIQVNPKRHPRVNATGAKAFIDWILSKDGQAAIANFKVNGQQLFYPNAKSNETAN